MTKKVCKVNPVKIQHCCRYNYALFKNTSIKDILVNNDWIFNDAWNFWAYFRDMPFIQINDASPEPIIEDHYILFTSTLHDFEDWDDTIEWDKYGAWYAYNFPLQDLKLKEVWLLGSEWELPTNIDNFSPLTDYFSISGEWQFIHDIQPDIFIVKNGKNVIVGSPDFSTVWMIRKNLS